MTREADIENRFVQYAASLDCLAMKLRVDGQNGFPDRTILTPRGGVLFMEFKTPEGKLRAMQRVYRKLLTQLSQDVYYPNSFEEAKRYLDEYLEHEKSSNQRSGFAGGSRVPSPASEQNRHDRKGDTR